MDNQPKKANYTHNKDSRTVTFVSECGRFKFTVKDSYIFNAIGDLIEEKMLEPVYNMNKFYNLFKYLHNENGPAIEYLETGTYAFFVNGKQCEDPEKLTHNYEFSKKFKSFLEE